MNNLLTPSAEALTSLLDDIRSILEPLPFVRKIMCFWSLARGDWDCWSDIDLLVITESQLQFVDILEALYHLQNITQKCTSKLVDTVGK